MTRALLVLLALALTASSAAAHQSSVTYVEADLDGATIRVKVRLAPRDLSEALGLGDAAQAPAALIAGREPAIAALVTTRVTVSDRPVGATADVSCDVVAAAGAPNPGERPLAITAEDERIAVTYDLLCPAPPARITLRYGLLFDLDRNHTAALRVRAPGRRPADALLSIDAQAFTWDLAEAPPSSAGAFLREGIHHVVTGFDHVAFVLALLLAVVLTRRPDGWHVRPIGASIRTTAGVVSAFTVAHSLTLIAAALGWVSLPGRLVEATIAASIVFTAAASVVRPDAPWRLLTAFAFGLVHGLGFARMLAVLLPPTDIVFPLLCFNLGVELAQLALVAVAVPLTFLLARALGPARYRTLALPALAAPLVILGAIWLIERLADG